MSKKPAKKLPQKQQNAVKGAKMAQKGTKGAKSARGKIWPVWALVLALVVVIGGGILFVGAVSGWFSGKVALDAEYYATTDGDFIELLTPERYGELTEQGKSFAVFIDQDGCTTADRIRQFATDYSKDTGVKMYRMMFSDLKETSLKGQVKYYPSLVVVSKGTPVKWLDANSDADADAYNGYDAFVAWMNDIIK